MAAETRNRDRIGGGTPAERWLLAAATWAVLLLPAALMYARAFGDGVLSVIAVLFLISAGITRSWGWLKAPWTRLMLAFWVWMMVCTWLAGSQHALAQATASIRFFVFIAALETWVLADPGTRRRLWYVILGCAVWILIECWQQYLFGVNEIGWPRWADGALTGPFRGPTAGGAYLMVFFPAFLPLCFLLLRRDKAMERLAGVAVMILAAATMILIGQRMPALLMTLGLVVSGLLFRQVRLPVILTIAVSVAVLALLPVISPPAFEKLVVHFTEQVQHFWATPYGLIFGRAMTMIQAHPWIGLGWDGFRDNCMNPTYLGGVSWLPVSDPASPLGCNIHPHNYWLQIATDAGLVGVVLFAALVVLWLRRIRGVAGDLGNDRRAALLVIVFVVMWPIASATSLFTVPNAGWIFLMVGWGLAEARWGLAELGSVVGSGSRQAGAGREKIA
ncbi:MAG TPA: polymerase [Acetobacteraceae bacterium]|jgi:O-antigen ligase|nr:polymerase [Acetobacteraceae bacterium]